MASRSWRASDRSSPHNLANRWVAAYVANCRAHAADLLGSPLRDRVVVTGDLFRRRSGAPDARRRNDRCRRAARAGPRRVSRPARRAKGPRRADRGVRARRRPPELLIAGGDWSAPDIRSNCGRSRSELGVADRIHFENHRQDVGAVLSTADIFVLPSRSDARPRSIIEAMSLGLPVVATDVGGIPSLVLHEQTGLLVPAEDAGALAAAIGSTDSSRRICASGMGAAGRRHAEQACRPDLTALEYVGLYRRLAGERQSRGRRDTCGGGACPELTCSPICSSATRRPRPAPQSPCVTVAGGPGLRFNLAELSAATSALGPGEFIAYSVRLDLPLPTRLVTIAALSYRLRQVERILERGRRHGRRLVRHRSASRRAVVRLRAEQRRRRLCRPVPAAARERRAAPPVRHLLLWLRSRRSAASS